MSYCHADQSWAAWLHKALESYRVPKRLVGSTGLYGAVPGRLTPIFRDRDELSSAADLSGKLKDALADSETLIVLCSPEAARSRWVNEEIRHFRSLGRGDRIYCVIVDGDPQASEPQNACFPAALLECKDDQATEPLAADARKWADGKPLAKLKLISGILGVQLDELRQREQQRKRKLQALAGFAILATTALLLFTIESRMGERDARLAKEAQRASAETMLARFLEQSERLGDVADLETRKAFGEVQSSYLADLDPTDLTLESRRQLGVVLLNRGVIFRDEGQLEQAMEAFRSAQQTLQLLVGESQGDAEALFELSQVEYWIGQVHLDLGRLQEAAISFKAYADVSDALHTLQPDNADWTMEAAYAQSNLGKLESSRIPSDPQLVLQYYEAALEFNKVAAGQDKKYERELAESHADLADAWMGVCDLAQAMVQRLKNVELAAKHHSLNPVNNSLKQDYANALSGLSRVQQKAGRLGLAMENLRQSLELQTELVEEDPNNLKKRWNLVRKSAYQAQLLELSGSDGESWDMGHAVEADIRELMKQDYNIRIDHAIAYGMFLRDFAYRAYRKGEPSLAARLLGECIIRLGEIAGEHPDNKKVLNELAMSYFYYWDHNDATLPDDSAREWLLSVKETLNLKGCSDLNIASRQAVMAGAEDEARTYVSRLIERGYHEPEFKRFCLKYGLCATQGD
jgi:hypothetical protein